MGSSVEFVRAPESLPVIRGRVVHVLGTTSVGGAENQALYLLEALNAHGLAPELIYFREGSNHDGFCALDIRMHLIPARRRLALDWPYRARALRRLLANDPPAVLHTWLYETHLVGLLAAASWRDTRVVLAHRSGTGVPGTRRQLLALRPARARIDHVVANSPAGAAVMSRFGVAADRISVIGNGVPRARVTVEIGRADVRRALGIGPEVPLLCAVTRPDPTKDLPSLLDAFRLVRAHRADVELLIVGTTKEDLASFGTRLPQRAHAIGFKPRPADYVNAADLVVIPSRTEGYSNAAAEALLQGLPVVTTATGAHVPLVAAAGGEVTPVGDPIALAGAILRILAAPPNRDSVSAVAASQLAMASIAEQTVALYARLLATPRGRNAPSRGGIAGVRERPQTDSADDR